MLRLALAEQADREVRLAAIAAVAAIRPSAARDVAATPTVSQDEEIADAAFEAVTLAEARAWTERRQSTRTTRAPSALFRTSSRAGSR